MRMPCPIEFDEEVALSQYCEDRGFLHWHVPQETYTDSWKQKAKNKAQGVLEGVSDHWVVIPHNGKQILLVIELKRQYGNTPTDAQIRFLTRLNVVDNVLPVCCYGADEAIRLIEELEKCQYTTLDQCKERVEKLRISRQKRQKNPKKPQNTTKTDKNELPY